MPAMFGGTPIGAMQYGGTPIAEAMIDGEIVWRAIITVTPQAPTFLDGAPWISLPDQEGVTYTVAGTPGYGQSVTVTATAEEGYVLEGTTEWDHSWATIPEKIALTDADTGPYRVLFAGSSTTQGWGQPQYESYAHLFLPRLLRHTMGAQAHQMVMQNSGSISAPTSDGFHFLNVGLGGTTSGNYLSDRLVLATSFLPHLVIHMIGANDYFEQMPLETYKSNLRSAINSFPTSTHHILAHTYRRQDRDDTGITWAEYGEALHEVSTEFSHAHFVNPGEIWEDRAPEGGGWWLTDDIHTSWRGAEELATALAETMDLDHNVGETLWAVDIDEGSQSSGTLRRTSDSLVALDAVSPSSGTRVNTYTSGGERTFTFNNSGARYADTDPWPLAAGFPLAFFVVVHTWGGNETTVAPFFSRSNSGDDGWWWVWRNSGTADYRAALNSAHGDPATLSSSTPWIIGVHMSPHSQATIYVNSTTGIGPLPPIAIDGALGPWMKSLRIGANASAGSHTAMRMKEMRFETAPMSAGDYMPQRMQALATKYGRTLD